MNRERSNWIFYCGMLATIQESRRSLKLENNRMGANLTIPIPMDDFAKFKILECSTIGQQLNWIEPCVPTTFVILFLYAIGVNEFKTMVLK